MYNKQAQASQIPTGGSSPVIATPTTPALKFSLRDYPITTGKVSDRLRYRRKFIATATANGHEEVLSSHYQVSNRRNDIQGFAYHQRLSEMTFSALDYSAADSIIRHKVNKHRASKDRRATFLEMDTF